MDTLLADVRSGIRMLVKYPTLSFVAVLTLGLGIGLSTTVFCVVNAGLFKGLPFPRADRVVALSATKPSQNLPREAVDIHDLDIWMARQTSFDKIGAFGFAAMNLSNEEGRPERFSGGQLTVAAFEAIGVTPILGRGFREGDDRPGADPIMLIGYDLWRDRFKSSPDIVGTSIRANGVFRTVIGVMPEKFAFPILERVWIPLSIDPLATPRGEGPTFGVIGRLKDGVSVAQAKAQIAGIAAQLEAEFPATNKGVGADVMPYAMSVFGPEIYGLLYTMLGAGVGVLLIACVNVSNLLVARASLRRREVAVRMALGAGSGRVVRQHLTEVLVLAIVGAAIGRGVEHLWCAVVRSGDVSQPATVLGHFRFGLSGDALCPRAHRAGQPLCRRPSGDALFSRERRRGTQRRQPIVYERTSRQVQQCARRRGAGGLVRVADCRGV